MIKSPFVVTLIAYIFLETASIFPLASNGHSDNSDDGFDWSSQLIKSDRTPTTLSCLLFSDDGCDAECYVVTMAYDLLSTGICNEDHTCDCTYVTYTTLDDLWSKKYSALNADVLREIQADPKLWRITYQTLLASPLQTGFQIKEKLRPYLGNLYEKVNAPYILPATKMFTEQGNQPIRNTIESHVKYALSVTTELSGNELSSMDYETALKKALGESRKDNDRRRNLILEIRRIQNKFLDAILAAHLLRNEPMPVDNPADISSATFIAYSVINNLVNKAELERNCFKKLVGWVGNKFKQIITSIGSRSADLDSDLEKKNRFLLPLEIDKNALAQRKIPFGETWRGQGYKIRYWKGDQGDIYLIWVKKSIRVSIRKTVNFDISQYWNFRTVEIIMSRTSEGDFRQLWDFGTFTYRYQKKSGKDDAAKEKWSNGNANEELLNEYRAYIDTWCQNNDILIETQDCIIYK